MENFNSNGTANFSFMDETLHHISTTEVGDTIEVVYKLISNWSFTSGYGHDESPNRIFKIIYSWEDGKMKKSDRIYGRLIPKQEERYEFD